MPDLPDYSQSVSIDATNVTIPVSGSVSITSGSVAITNASIAVINATGTKITSARPPQQLTVVGTVGVGLTTNTVTLPSDVQALVVHFPGPLVHEVQAIIAWHPIGGQSTSWQPLHLYQFSQAIYVVPITPTARAYSAGSMTQIDCSNQSDGTYSEMEVYALFESAPIWLELFPQPQLEPNQAPGAILKTLAANVGQWLITPVANVQISLFEIIELYTTNFSAQDVIAVGHASVLPANQAAATGLLIEMGPMGTAAFVYPYHGAQLPRGDGIYVINLLSAAGNFGCAINYSLS